MKKSNILMLIAIAALSFTSCGNKTNSNGEGADSVTTDSPTEAPVANIHTEEAVREQITAYYNELNNMSEGEMDMTLLDSIACTKSLLALMEQVEEKSMKAIAQGSDAYFEDEGNRWFQGLGTPIKVQFDDITDPTEDRVEAYLTLSWSGQTAPVRLRLIVEDGQWKIDDFADYDTDGVGFRTDMEYFLGINNESTAG